MKLQTGSDHRLAHFTVWTLLRLGDNLPADLLEVAKLGLGNVLGSDSAEDGPDAQRVLALIKGRLLEAKVFKIATPQFPPQPAPERLNGIQVWRTRWDVHQADAHLRVERAEELGAQEGLVVAKQAACPSMPPRLEFAHL